MIDLICLLSNFMYLLLVLPNLSTHRPLALWKVLVYEFVDLARLYERCLPTTLIGVSWVMIREPLKLTFTQVCECPVGSLHLMGSTSATQLFYAFFELQYQWVLVVSIIKQYLQGNFIPLQRLRILNEKFMLGCKVVVLGNLLKPLSIISNSYLPSWTPLVFSRKDDELFKFTGHFALYGLVGIT